MDRKVWIGFVVVFILLEILMFIVDGIFLAGTYSSLQNIWRSDMSSKMWIFHLVNIFVAFFFSFIFSKGYENRGIWEGVRYGFYVGVWLSVPAAYATYAMIEIPHSLALQWLIFGVIEYITAGIALAYVFKGVKPKQAVA